MLLNPAPALRELDMSYACKCDFFVPNETELEILTGMPVDTYDHIRAAARSLVDKGLNNIIVTMGEKGALWMTRDPGKSMFRRFSERCRYQRRGRCLYRLFRALLRPERGCGSRHEKSRSLCRFQRHRERHPILLSKY